MGFRKFISQSEPVFIGYIHGLCERHFTSEELKNQIRDCRKGWKRTIVQAGIKLEVNGKKIKSERIADLWINGHYFHDDPEKSKELTQYAPPTIFMVRHEFINFVIEATRVILSTGYTIKVALRDGSIAF